MLANRHELHSANTSTAPTTPAAPQASQGRKQLQLNAEDTVPKCSKTDTTQEEQNNDEEDSNNDNNDNKKPKKALVKGRGEWLPSRWLRLRLRMQKACLPISNCKPSSPPSSIYA